MRPGMCIDMRIDMHGDICPGMHVDMCTYMRMDMGMGMCVDMHSNICTGTCDTRAKGIQTAISSVQR